jgi:hypothetical protein
VSPWRFKESNCSQFIVSGINLQDSNFNVN